MGEAKITISAEDHASNVIDQVQKRLGVFNKEGLAMGIAFAAVTKGIQFAEQAIGKFVEYIQQGIEMNRKFDASMARLSVSTRDFDISISGVKDSLKNFSVMFAEDLNVLASGLQLFIREGHSVSESIKLLFNSERLAIAVGEDLSTTQGAVNTAMEIFDLTANSAGHIVDNYNKILSATGLSLGEIDRLLGNSAGKIRDNALSFDDVVNILYNLESQGYYSRGMLVKFKEVLDTYPSALNDTTVGMKNVEKGIVGIGDKLGKITGTTQFTQEQLKKVKEISQMDLTKGMDIGAGIDQSQLDVAKEYFDTLNSEGITTLEKLNEEISSGKDRYNVWGEMPLRDAGNYNAQILTLLQSIYQYNDLIDETTSSDFIGAIEETTTAFTNLQNELRDTNTSIATHIKNIATLQAEQTKLTTIHNINNDLRYMSLGLTDASYATKIQNSATKDLVDSIRVQQDEIQRLQDINESYSLSSMKNSLEILRIQRIGMDSRRGLTRSQKAEIKELEKADADLRISTMENQISIGEIKQNGLTADERHLEQVKNWYSEELFTIQDTYTAEMTALTDKIIIEQGLLEANYVAIVDVNRRILENEKATYDARKAIWAGNPEQAAELGIPKPPDMTFEQFQGFNDFFNKMSPWKLPHHDTGGYVTSTHPAIVHRGENIIPANQNHPTAVYVKVEPITVHNYNYDKTDTAQLAQKLQLALQQGLIAGITTKYS